MCVGPEKSHRLSSVNEKYYARTIHTNFINDNDAYIYICLHYNMSSIGAPLFATILLTLLWAIKYDILDDKMYA